MFLCGYKGILCGSLLPQSNTYFYDIVVSAVYGLKSMEPFLPWAMLFYTFKFLLTI